ncbi:MAG: sulfite exporter TauE/SafE family protein [Saprospiraceae bacterium]|nr:sulfite exporter TauE/SafE family protein [Saprospiraceae bacterium]
MLWWPCFAGDAQVRQENDSCTKPFSPHVISPWITTPVFLALGFYGGFIQMGMGIFFLAAMVLGARYSLTDSNAVKSAVVGLYTFLAILIFAWNGEVEWKLGALMAIGQTAGGCFTAGTATTRTKANIWVPRH